MRERSRTPARQRLLDGFRERSLIERRDRAGEWTAERSIARTPCDPFQSVVPERHPAQAVEDRHALIDRFEDFTAAVLVLEAVDVAAVRAIGAVERHGDDRQQLPHAMVEDFDQPHGDTGADEIIRSVHEQSLRPRSIDRRLVHERRNHFGRDALHEAVRDEGRRDRDGLPRPCEMAGHAAESDDGQRRRFDRDHDAAGVDQQSA